MKYIIATHSCLIAVEFDSAWNILSHQLINTGHHYGIGIITDELATGKEEKAVKQIVVYRGGKSHLEQTEPAFVRYNLNNLPDSLGLTTLTDELMTIHQVAYANNGLYVANTEHNSVVFCTINGEKINEYFFEGVHHDWNHVNSVFPCDNRILVLLHNRHRKKSEIAILDHDLGTGFHLQQQLSVWHENCHNIFLDDRELVYNASSAGEFVVVDLKTDRIAKRFPFNNQHTKGLSVTEHHYVIGVSDRASREERSRSSAYLAIIDRNTKSLVKMVDLNFPTLPHPIGNINEIRCISGGELSHAQPYLPAIDLSTKKLFKRDKLRYVIYKAKKTLLPFYHLYHRYTK